ncbi:hexose transporter [Phaffia rhodozyma]|uniref:Hexose transporter n=1 Tax=Phaffia rhodozyma TaxID=264483 RepID=A0A0F7SL67_PHARH|nr:hexose transporter [Phaffia rhodozyma]
MSLCKIKSEEQEKEETREEIKLPLARQENKIHHGVGRHSSAALGRSTDTPFMSHTTKAAAPPEDILPKELEPYVYRGRWYRHPGIRAISLLLFVALITSSTNGYDGSMMNGLQVLTNWKDKFHNPQGGTLGLLNAIQNIGTIVGVPFAPMVTDRFGRRAGILVGSIIMLIGVTTQATSQTISVFIISRAIIGLGLTFATNAAPILIAELAYPTQRAAMTSLYNSLWYSGSIVAAWTTFGTFRINNSMSWRIPSILQATPSVIQVCLIYFVPESPRWLVSKGRHADAQRVLARYHTGNNNEQDPLVEFEMAEITQSLELEKHNSTSWASLTATKGNRKRLRIVVSYYLTDVLEGVGITSQNIQSLYNGILQLFNLAVAVGAAVYVDKIGRRTLFLTSNIGMFITWIFWTTCEGVVGSDINNRSAAYAILAFIYIYYFFYDIAYTPLLVAYTVEITPFKMRAKMLTVMQLGISGSLVFNQYVNPIALEKIGWKYYIVYLVWLAIEVVFVYFFVVETKNRTLEETGLLFESNGIVEEVDTSGHMLTEEHHISHSVYCSEQRSYVSRLMKALPIPNSSLCESALDEISSLSASSSSSYFSHSPTTADGHSLNARTYTHPFLPTLSSSPSYSLVHTPISPSPLDHAPLVILETHFQSVSSRQVKHDSDYDDDAEEAQEDSIIFFATAKHAKSADRKDFLCSDSLRSWLDQTEGSPQSQEVGAFEKSSLARLVQNPLHCRWATGTSIRSN